MVYTLFQLVKDRTDILSAAFTRGPIRECIFIEADLNSDLLNFMRCMPGIVKKSGNPIVKVVPLEDRIGTIRLPKDLELSFTVGQWVQVTRGTHKGDLGYVRDLKAWGGVQLLLVPRLRLPSSLSSKKKGKRPRAIPPPDQALFHPSVIEKHFHVSPTQKGTNTYFFNGFTYEHGLLVKELDVYSVSTSPVFISSNLHILFLSSNHPAILKAQFPPPLEWKFFLEELVYIIEGPHRGKLGHIKLILPAHFDVDLNTMEGLFRLPWHNVRKHFVIGDFIKVVGGIHEGITGFVHSIAEDGISIIQRGDIIPDGNCPVMEVFFPFFNINVQLLMYNYVSHYQFNTTVQLSQMCPFCTLHHHTLLMM